ncbi:Arc family DNA-binding protein [Aurantimonas sp. C2-6-R+9]|uniref:Arc family DNA-binding protein n=1 Tax=unclassified Aurantimonas TaxID=2638230 RepID=UPI002E1840DC|nr:MULTISPECIES: Arc family DNA-binding protein [unclassified Aurantimonas]MEC5291366.1 Arc family DNA-binding protein [Aurantimonas sp. C2-3-R2]MEC5381572.1 Arc family DNA-binding protein [Aurantimonas sp. C2-6-R+9]MEC5412453.1 Arc family DNA-binding protein [Aurantimonas sp. C2-4-R8]
MTYPHPISVRIPAEVKDWLKSRAEENSRTVSGELLAILKATKQAEDAREAA